MTDTEKLWAGTVPQFDLAVVQSQTNFGKSTYITPQIPSVH